jgi:Protein kinase domain
MPVAGSVGSDPLLGREVAGYRLEAVIGRGGMGVVYLAEDLALERKVALKLLAPELSEDERFRARFHRESRLAAAIDHPNVVPIYDAGEAAGVLYIVMRYVEGTDLRTVLLDDGALEPPRALALLSQVAEALDAAHARGLVHRDVKPSNVLVASVGGREHAYLADFGLTLSGTVRSSALAGSPEYVAPEQVSDGVVDARSDVYSLGCMLFECLAGAVPFRRGSEFEVLYAQLSDDAPTISEQRPGLPRALDTVLARALAKDPRGRFETAGELIMAARAAVPAARPRRRWAVALAVAVVAAGAGVGLWLTMTGQRSATAPTLEVAGGAVQRVDPASGELVATYDLEGPVVDIVAGPRGIWGLDSARGLLVRIDPGTGARMAKATAHRAPIGLVATGSTLGIVAEDDQGAVAAAIDPEHVTQYGEIRIRSESPGELWPVTAVSAAAISSSHGRVAVWVADAAGSVLYRVAPRIPMLVTIDVGGTPLALAASGETLWVGLTDEILTLDFSGRIVSRAPVEATPVALSAGAEGIWAADVRGTVARLDSVGRPTRRLALRRRIVDLAVGNGSVWALAADGALIRIDPERAQIVGEVAVGQNPTALTVSRDGVWVAVGADTPRSSSVPRRIDSVPPGFQVDAIQPAAPGEVCDLQSIVRNCVLVTSGPFATTDGITARVRTAFALRPRKHRTTSCNGTEYADAVVSDVVGRDAGVARIDFAGLGTVGITWERALSVHDGTTPASRVLCVLRTGTWAGVSGSVRGLTGTMSDRYSENANTDESVWTFEPAAVG